MTSQHDFPLPSLAWPVSWRLTAPQALLGEAYPTRELLSSVSLASKSRLLSSELPLPGEVEKFEFGLSCAHFYCPPCAVLCNREKAWHANWKGSLKSSCSLDADLRLSESPSLISHLQRSPSSSMPRPLEPPRSCVTVSHVNARAVWDC